MSEGDVIRDLDDFEGFELLIAPQLLDNSRAIDIVGQDVVDVGGSGGESDGQVWKFGGDKMVDGVFAKRKVPVLGGGRGIAIGGVAQDCPAGVVSTRERCNVSLTEGFLMLLRD